MAARSGRCWQESHCWRCSQPTPPADAAVAVTGSGSTFAAIAIDQWRADAARKLAIQVYYSGSGSSTGRSQFSARTVDWASSDIAFAPGENPGRPFTYIPLVADGTALMYNLVDGAGRRITDLQLSGPTIARIYAREITYWNDPQIKSDNPHLAARLPGTEVKPAARSGGSGPTAVFTGYLAHVAPDVWARLAGRYQIQGSFTSNFPPVPGVTLIAGSGGIADFVARSDPGAAGAIGYAEAGYAQQQGLTTARVRNQAGRWTQPTARAVAIALTQAQRNPDGTQNLSRVYTHGDPESYAISSYNYAILPGDIDPAKGDVLGKFIIYSITEGQGKAAALGYSPLPPNLVQQGLDNIKFIPGAPPAPPLGNWGRFYEELGVDPATGGGGGHAGRALPLGPGGLPETRTSTQVTPGVTHTRIVRGEGAPTDAYVVDVGFRSTKTEARQLERRLRSDGFATRVERIRERAPDDPRVDPLGYLVRVGNFASPAEATEARDRLAALGYAGLRVVHSGEDGRPTTGPWVVNVLEVDPALFEGSLGPALATQVVPGLERLTALASQNGALAAVNGGYFVIGPADGTPGDLAGISVLGGALVSEAVNGRTSLILPSGDGAGADVAALSTRQVALSSDGAKKLVDGLNRKPGLIRGCGGRGGDVPTEEPKHDFTCTDGSELILFTPSFGDSTEPGEGTEAALDAGGTVIEVRNSRGGTIPPGGSVLSGTGRSGNWLRAHARPGASITVRTEVLADDRPLDLAGGAGVVNGGPRLVRDGQVEITAAAEGFHWEESPEFYYRFGVRRNPRTLAGVTAEGKLLLVTVDGRQPGVSVGASFEESGRIMQALGAVEAVNLDGGGSTAMVVGQDLVNTPSDASGERAIADAVVIRG